MKTKKRKASSSILIVLIVAILLIVSVTFAAIFRTSISVTRSFSVTNLKAQTVVSFVGVSEEEMEEYTTEYGVLATVDPFAKNFIGNLRASVQYSGRGVGLIRVRMVEEWSIPTYTTTTDSQTGVSTTTKTGRTVQPYQVEIPYILPTGKEYDKTNDTGNQSKWYDNRLNDYCFYYATPVYCTGAGTIDLITGVNTSEIDLGLMPRSTEVHVMVETDAVQVNRYPQYWGIASLPWGGVSASAGTNDVQDGADVSLAAS